MGFRRVKAAFFLDIAEKMQSLSLLRLIEKFAGIHRQVSLRSLTAVGLGIPTCFFRIEPVSIAECFAFCSETTSPFFEMGLRWAAAQTRLGLHPKPQQETSFPAPSLRCAGLNLDFQIEKT